MKVYREASESNSSARSPKFYTFSQNNSGGSFTYNERFGITHVVVIEAYSASDANSRAQDIGIYFDGVSNGVDCSCCGSRWCAQWDSNEGTEQPEVYGCAVADDPLGSHKWMAPNPEIFVHYMDGRIEGY